MSASSKQAPAGVIRFLYTNIGRGHPYYLDGIIEALVRSGQASLIKEKTDVFEISRGLAKVGWQAARYLYRKGSSDPLIGKIYGRLRKDSDYNRSSLTLKIMGSQIRKKCFSDSTPLMVAHPSLVGILTGRKKLLYQHGEVIAPDEALVLGADVCFVPTDSVRERFISAGYGSEQVIVSGLCVEPALASQAEKIYFERLIRIEQSPTLTGAFFSSGAEPAKHLELIVRSALALTKAGHKALIFASGQGSLSRKVVREFTREGQELAIVNATDTLPDENVSTSLIRFESRREENHFTASLFPRFDFLVAPAHERSNWALGLGLPIFVLNPCIGPFAPLNREMLCEHSVSSEIDSVDHATAIFANIGGDSSRRRLQTMSSSGWGKYEVDGFKKIAELLQDRFRKC